MFKKTNDPKQIMICFLKYLGYQPVVTEEIHFRCNEDHTVEPFRITLVTFILDPVEPSLKGY